MIMPRKGALQKIFRKLGWGPHLDGARARPTSGLAKNLEAAGLKPSREHRRLVPRQVAGLAWYDCRRIAFTV